MRARRRADAAALTLVPSEAHVEAELGKRGGAGNVRVFQDFVLEVSARLAREATPALPHAVRLLTAQVLSELEGGRLRWPDEPPQRASLAVSMDQAIGRLRRASVTPAHLRALGTPHARVLADVIARVDALLAAHGLVDPRGLGAIAALRIREASRAQLHALDPALGSGAVILSGLVAFRPDDLAVIEALHARLRDEGGAGVSVVLPRLAAPEDPVAHLAGELARRWAELADAPEIVWIEARAPQAIQAITARDADGEARAVVAAALTALSRRAAPERIAILVPALDEDRLSPLRAALVDARLPFAEPRGRPASREPAGRILLGLLAIAAGPVTREQVIELLRAPGLHLGAWMDTDSAAEAASRAALLAHRLREVPVEIDRTGLLLALGLRDLIAARRRNTARARRAGPLPRRRLDARVPRPPPRRRAPPRRAGGLAPRAGRAPLRARVAPLPQARRAARDRRGAALGSPLREPRAARAGRLRLGGARAARGGAGDRRGRGIGGPRRSPRHRGRARRRDGDRRRRAPRRRGRERGLRGRDPRRRRGGSGGARARSPAGDGPGRAVVRRARRGRAAPRRAAAPEAPRRAPPALGARSRAPAPRRAGPRDRRGRPLDHQLLHRRRGRARLAAPLVSLVRGPRRRAPQEPFSRVARLASSIDGRSAELCALARGAEPRPRSPSAPASSARAPRISSIRARRATRSRGASFSATPRRSGASSPRSAATRPSDPSPSPRSSAPRGAPSRASRAASSTCAAAKISASPPTPASEARSSTAPSSTPSEGVRERGDSAEDPARLLAAARAHAEAGLGLSSALAPLRREAIEQAIADAVAVVARALHTDADLRFRHAEQAFGSGDEWPALALVAESGEDPALALPVWVDGQIDRIDVAVTGSRARRRLQDRPDPHLRRARPHRVPALALRRRRGPAARLRGRLRALRRGAPARLRRRVAARRGGAARPRSGPRRGLARGAADHARAVARRGRPAPRQGLALRPLRGARRLPQARGGPDR